MAKSDAAGDGMATAELPAGPWHYETTARRGEPDGTGHVYIVDATGRKIMSVWGSAATKMAIAELVLRARDAAP
jgi:hypothetical protein